MEPKICPIMTIGENKLGIDCKGESCAWYISGSKRCAMALLAESADLATDRLGDIAYPDPPGLFGG